MPEWRTIFDFYWKWCNTADATGCELFQGYVWKNTEIQGAAHISRAHRKTQLLL